MNTFVFIIEQYQLWLKYHKDTIFCEKYSNKQLIIHSIPIIEPFQTHLKKTLKFFLH